MFLNFVSFVAVLTGLLSSSALLLLHFATIVAFFMSKHTIRNVNAEANTLAGLFLNSILLFTYSSICLSWFLAVTLPTLGYPLSRLLSI